MSYQVKLDVYEGPFDLLLHLISRRRVEVTDVDLAEITADFVAHLAEGIDDVDLETATRFLVVAATLIELKAVRLLPREERHELEDLLGEARDLLYARLLEYRAFRDVGRVLGERLDDFADRQAREVTPEPWLLRLVPDVRLPVDAQGLAALAAATASPRPVPEVDLAHIRRSYLTIRDAAAHVLRALPDEGRTSFAELTAGRARAERVMLFLALLELFKLGHVDLEQAKPDAPLEVERRGVLAELVDALSGIDDPEDGIASEEVAPPGSSAAIGAVAT